MNSEQYAKQHTRIRIPPIPPEDRQYYPPAVTHFDRIISIYDRGLDRTVAWRCPDCGFQCASRSYFTPASPPPEQ